MAKKIKFIAVGDNHGDMVDEYSAKELFKFCDSYQPDEVIHLGDGYDLRSIRRGAAGKEADESLVKDILKGHWFIRNLKPTVFMYGNRRRPPVPDSVQHPEWNHPRLHRGLGF